MMACNLERILILIFALGSVAGPLAMAGTGVTYKCSIVLPTQAGELPSVTNVTVSDQNPANLKLEGTNVNLNLRTYLGEIIVELVDPSLTSAIFSTTQPAGAWLEIRLGNPRLSVSCAAL